MLIREYHEQDELAWVRCRVLSFLDSAYYDNVLREKECYDYPAIELVAEVDGQIVGILDVEYEEEPGQVCYLGGGLGGVIWHLAVLPEFRRRGIPTALLGTAIDMV